MARLTAADRRKLPTSSFAEPDKRAFPMNDRTHAALAISGATRSFHAGHIDAAEKDRIQAQARARLGHPPKKK